MGVYNGLIITAVFITIAAWYLHTPVPEGFSQPWKLRWKMGRVKLQQDIAWLKDFLNITPMHITMRSDVPMLNVSTPDHITIKDMNFDGVRVRLYQTNKKPSNPDGHPGFVFYHGGGWVVGTPEVFEAAMIKIATEINIVVLSVAYRKAPEAIYPIPLEDSITAAKYFLKHGNTFGVNTRRIAIGGASAGGNLAAAAALKLRDEGFAPMPKAQVLIYPCLQAHDFLLPSYTQNKNGPLLTTFRMTYFWSMYATGTKKYSTFFTVNDHTTPEVKNMIGNSYINHENIDTKLQYYPYKKPTLNYGDSFTWNEIKGILSDPYFAPLMADDLSGLPEAYVYTAHYDVLRDDGLLYVNRLRDAGVTVSHVHAMKGFHGLFARFLDYAEGTECMDSVITYLRNVLTKLSKL